MTVEEFILTYFIWLVALLGAVVAVVIVYFFYYKPRQESPLDGETPLGWLSIYLTKGKGLREGYACTALHTLQRWFSTTATEELDPDLRKKIEETWELFKYIHPIAHKVGRTTYIYLFDDDPLDQKYLDVDPYVNEGRIINGVQDVVDAGEFGGMTFLSVKLNPQTFTFTEKEKEAQLVYLDVAKYLKDAAKNLTRIKYLKEEFQSVFDDRERVLKKLGKMTAKYDKAISALGIKPLTQPEEAKLPSDLGQKIKEWFTWTQLVTGLVGYLLAPYIVKWANLALDEPVLTYFVAFVTVIGFFSIPIFKKIFGRWL